MSELKRLDQSMSTFLKTYPSSKRRTPIDPNPSQLSCNFRV